MCTGSCGTASTCRFRRTLNMWKNMQQTLLFIAVLTATAALVTTAPSAKDGVFCSRTQVQETSVRQQLLDTGQLMISTHVLTSLRVGETVCISALLPEPPEPPVREEAEQAEDNKGDGTGTGETNETRLVNTIGKNEKDRAGVSGESSSINSTSRKEQLDYKNTPTRHRTETRDSDARQAWTHQQRDQHEHEDQQKDRWKRLRQKQYQQLDRRERSARLSGTSDSSGLRRALQLEPAVVAASLSRLRPSPSLLATDVPRLRIQLTLQSIHHQHPITAAYDFSEPHMDVTCTCACASFHMCSGCGSLCVSKSSASAVADCEGSFLGSARTCCQLKLRPGAAFSAVRLGMATTFLQLQVAVTELGGGRPPVTEKQTLEAPLGDTLQVEMNATRLRMSAAAPAALPAAPPGWYVLHQDRLYRPQQINELNEYNLEKLGWLKRRGEDHLMPSGGRLAAAVDVITESCTEQQFQVRGDLLLDSTLPQLGPPLPELQLTQRTATHVRLLPAAPGRPVWLGLHLQHLQRLHYLVHRARLADFDGSLHVDARSALLAELQLFNGSGVQHGSLLVDYGGREGDGEGGGGDDGRAAPTLYRFSLLAERRLRLRLPVALPPQQQMARLCLQPEGSSAAAALCRDLPVRRQKPETLRADVTSDSQLTVDGQSNPTNNMERFLRALNPATWLQSGGSWTTAFGAVVDIVLLIVAITIIWKCVSCCRACCCTTKKK